MYTYCIYFHALPSPLAFSNCFIFASTPFVITSYLHVLNIFWRLLPVPTYIAWSKYNEIVLQNYWIALQEFLNTARQLCTYPVAQKWLNGKPRTTVGTSLMHKFYHHPVLISLRLAVIAVKVLCTQQRLFKKAFTLYSQNQKQMSSSTHVTQKDLISVCSSLLKRYLYMNF